MTPETDHPAPRACVVCIPARNEAGAAAAPARLPGRAGRRLGAGATAGGGARQQLHGLEPSRRCGTSKPPGILATLSLRIIDVRLSGPEAHVGTGTPRGARCRCGLAHRRRPPGRDPAHHRRRCPPAGRLGRGQPARLALRRRGRRPPRDRRRGHDRSGAGRSACPHRALLVRRPAPGGYPGSAAARPRPPPRRPYRGEPRAAGRALSGGRGPCRRCHAARTMRWSDCCVRTAPACAIVQTCT